MLFEHLLCFLHAHHHERRSISVGFRAALCEHRCRENAVLHGIARSRVDSVCIFLAATIVEVAVVAACRHSAILHVEHGLQLVVHVQRVVRRLRHANLPRQTLFADAVRNHLAANLHHIVLYAALFEQTRHHIAAVAFSNSAAVEHYARISLRDAMVHELHLLVTHDSTQRVYRLLCWRIARLEAESPCVHKRCHRYVERSVGVVGDFLSQIKHTLEHLVRFHVLAAIDVRDDRLLVEHRQSVVHLLQFCENVCLNRRVVLISDVIERAEYLSLIVLIRHATLLSYNIYCSDNEEHE